MVSHGLKQSTLFLASLGSWLPYLFHKTQGLSQVSVMGFGCTVELPTDRMVFT